MSSLLFNLAVTTQHYDITLNYIFEETSISARSKRLMQFMNDFLVAKKR